MDDWFSEPAPKPTLNECYTRRLVAWGWITGRGETLWDKTPVFRSLFQEYTRVVSDMLKEPCIFLGPAPWYLNPEAPVDDRDGKVNISLWNEVSHPGNPHKCG